MLVSMGKVGASSLPAAACTSCWRTCKVQGVQLRLPLLKLPPEPSPFRYQWGEGTRYLQMPHPAWGQYSKFVHRDRSTSIFSIQVRTQTGHSSHEGWNLQRRWVSLLTILPSDSTVQQKEPVHCVPLEKMFPHTSSAGFGASNSQWHHWLRIPGQRDSCSAAMDLCLSGVVCRGTASEMICSPYDQDMQSCICLHGCGPEKQKVLLWCLFLPQLGIIWINKAWSSHKAAMILSGLLQPLQVSVLTV